MNCTLDEFYNTCICIPCLSVRDHSRDDVMLFWHSLFPPPGANMHGMIWILLIFTD